MHRRYLIPCDEPDEPVPAWFAVALLFVVLAILASCVWLTIQTPQLITLLEWLFK